MRGMLSYDLDATVTSMPAPLPWPERWPPDDHPLHFALMLLDRLLDEQSDLLADREAAGRRLRRAALQQLYGIRNERLLTEQLRYNLLYRWFVGVDYAGTGDGSAQLGAAVDRLMRLLQRDPSWQALLQDEHFSPDPAICRRWNESAEDCGGGDQREQRMTRARDHVLQHIADPELDADQIARALCMSRRALFLLFAAHGTSPTRMIQTLRLERCHALLSEASRPVKITAVALDHGFREYGTFSRLFKTQYGMTPSELRRRCLDEA